MAFVVFVLRIGAVSVYDFPCIAAASGAYFSAKSDQKSQAGAKKAGDDEKKAWARFLNESGRSFIEFNKAPKELKEQFRAWRRKHPN